MMRVVIRVEKSKYIGKPNLLRIAMELAGYKDPDKVLAALQMALKCSVDDPADGKDDLSLPIS